MAVDSDNTPMVPIRDVLNKIEGELYKSSERPDKYQAPCSRCNGTGTELIYREMTKEAVGARPCTHQ